MKIPLRVDTLPIIAKDDCPPDTIYLLPQGSKTWNLTTGEILELAPGYYVNPRHLGKITRITMD